MILGMNSRLYRRYLVIILLVPIAALSLVSPQIVPGAHAAPTGLVCVTSSISAKNCPSTSLLIGSPPVGSTLSVGVFVQNSQAMAGFEIYVAVNPSFLNPTSASLGPLITNPYLTDICINNVSLVGSCTVRSANGPGVVQVDTIDSVSSECGGFYPCSGMAFTINYTVVGAPANTPIYFPTYTPSSGVSPCASSSVSSPANVCVLLADYSGFTLPETVQEASVSQGATTRDPTSLTISCAPNSVTVGTTTICNATVTDATTVGAANPTGAVTFSTSGTGTFSPSDATCSLVADGSNVAQCDVSYTPTVSGFDSAPGTNDNIEANYTGDSTHQTSLAGIFLLFVAQDGTSMTLALNSTNIVLGGSVQAQATLRGGYPSSGVSGFVLYRLIHEPVPIACNRGVGEVQEELVHVGPSNSVSPAIFTPSAAGAYAVTAQYGGDENNLGSFACKLFFVNDFTISATSTFLTVPAGSSVSDVLYLSGLVNFTGPVNLSSSSVPEGVSVAFDPDPVPLASVNGVPQSNSTLHLSVASSARTSTFTLIVTASSGIISHQVGITVAVTTGPAPQMTKLNWDHNLALPAVQSWKAFILNSQKSVVYAVVRVQGHGTSSIFKAFDIVCGVTCVPTVGGSVNTTPGLTPISINAGLTARPRFQDSLGDASAGQTMFFTATLYWAAGSVYVEGNSINGTFYIDGSTG